MKYPLDEHELYVKSNKRTKDIKVRLEEYIEFAEELKRFSDSGFYREVLHHITELEKRIDDHG